MNNVAVPPRTAAEVRRWVRDRSPQPFDDVSIAAPPAECNWLYGTEQYELAVLARLVAEGFAANRHVHYPRNHGRVATATTFRAKVRSAGRARLRISGSVDVVVDGLPTETAMDGAYVTFRIPPGARVVECRVAGGEGVVPAIAVGPDAPLSGWAASVEGGPWQDVQARVGGERPPHLESAGTVEVFARGVPGSVLDIGAPVLGRPFLPPGPRPIVSSGESREEALAGSATHETRHDLVELPDGRWTTKHRLGFRYLLVRSEAPPDRVAVEASVPVIERPGAFACSDDRLTRIWASAQYTLRLCMQGLMIDGIKRDRMPWAGDQALSTLANAFAVGDGGVVADGLVALGRPDHGYVNGISDYSLWWVVNADLHLRYFGDGAFALAQQERLHAFVEDLARHAGHDGVFRPASQAGGFVDSGPGSVFIDWGLSLDNGRDSVALQMLWYWALRSAEHVLERAGHPGAERWRRLGAQLAATLRERAWLHRHERWADYLDERVSKSPAAYANFIAVLSGMHEKVPQGVREAVLGGTTGTPFMTAFRLRAALAAGETRAVVEEVRRVWGAMLDLGPGTFWEESTTDGDPLAMYGRAFGRSLCHAWSAGPAAILPEAVLGLAPVDDGWSRFTVRPELGDLTWASAVVPAAAGDIVVFADREGTTVHVPPGTVLVRSGHAVPGPSVVAWTHARPLDISQADWRSAPHTGAYGLGL